MEGYEVWVYGPKTMIATIDDQGKAFFDFEAPAGEKYLVQFNTNFENFNPQGIAAIEWSPTLTSDKLEDQFTVGANHKVDLLAIPATNISVLFKNDVPEIGDSIYLLVRHELYSTEVILDKNRSGRNLSYSSPIGVYNYEGISISASDTTSISGSFEVPHDEFFRREILL